MAVPRKSVLITGCSAGGIGAGLAEAFHIHGFHVFATLRNHSKVPSNLANTPNITVLILDVLSSQSIAATVSSVTTLTGGRLDVLVNNSGQNLVMPALDLSIEDCRGLFDLNFFAPLAIIQAFAPLLIKARGCIVNQSSAASHVTVPFMSMYSASKAALNMATETWRRELEPLGIRTITLITTGVRTSSVTTDQMPRIPQTSYYYAIRDCIYRLAYSHLQGGSPDPLTYALKVVKIIENGAVGEVWVGRDAGVSYWAWRLLPQSLFDYMIDSSFKLSRELAKIAS